MFLKAWKERTWRFSFINTKEIGDNASKGWITLIESNLLIMGKKRNGKRLK
jgi:hypothetical protein